MFGFVPTFTGSGFRASFAGASVSTRHATASRWTMKTKAVPGLEPPPTLPEKPGNYDFDPMGMSANMNQDWVYAAERKHGRVCMLASIGMLVQSFVHLPNAMYAEANPIKAIYAAPTQGMVQIIMFISIVELVTFKKPTMPGGENLGFDPLGLGKDGKWTEAEISNGRLAMLGTIGLISQTLATGQDPISQLVSFGG